MLPVESCLLEAVDLQDDKTLQYSFLRAPRREKSKMYIFLSAIDVNVISCLCPPINRCVEGEKETNRLYGVRWILCFELTLILGTPRNIGAFQLTGAYGGQVTNGVLADSNSQ